MSLPLQEEAATPKGEQVLLVGNPNVGKSALFGALTGLHATVSNYPGTTVEITRGPLPGGGELVDTPGVNSLLPLSDEERVARDMILSARPATAVVVADEKNPSRGIALALQLGELEVPSVLCLNMSDEAEARGIRVDPAGLERALGIPVVRTVATRGQGVAELRRALGRAAIPGPRVDYGMAIEEGITGVGRRLAPAGAGVRGLAVLLLSGDRTLAPWLQGRVGAGELRAAEEIGFALAAESGEPLSSRIRRARTGRAERIAAAATLRSRPDRAASGRIAARFGAWALHPVWGKAILLGVLAAMFWIVGLVGAGTLVDALETGLFGEFLVPAAMKATDFVLPFPHEHSREPLRWEITIPLLPARDIPTGLAVEREVPSTAYEVRGPLGASGKILRFLHDMLVGPYGLLTMGIPYAIAIVLPIVTLFFFCFGILEDSGYLPRLAVVVNRAFRAIGLNGKAVLPMVLGLGCVTMATLTTRILDSRKQRLLVMFLLALAIPCSAQLGVVLGLLASVSLTVVVVWGAIVVAVLLGAGWLGSRLLPGKESPLVLELPPIRRPLLSNLGVKTFSRLEWYLREAVPLFLIGTLVLFLLDRTGALPWAEKGLAPVVNGLLGLPPHAAAAFLVGFLRRDYGAVFLLDAAKAGLLSRGDVLVASVVVTLFVPCFASFLLIGREWGWRMAVLVLALVLGIAFLAGGAIHGVLLWTGWSL